MLSFHLSRRLANISRRGQELGGRLVGEALRVASEIPAWTPGEYQGEKVAVGYILPIFCRLSK